jgi:hypothetical protein
VRERKRGGEREEEGRKEGKKEKTLSITNT